jgi:hypothetical protein
MITRKRYKAEGITISCSSFSGGSACGVSRYDKCTPNRKKHKSIKLYIDGKE